MSKSAGDVMKELLTKWFCVQCPVLFVHRINCEDFRFLARRGDASQSRSKLRGRNAARGQKDRNFKKWISRTGH